MTGITAGAMAQTKDEKELATAVESLRTAMISGEQAALENIVSPDLSYGHSGGHVEGKEEFVKKFVTKQSDFVTMDLSNQTLKITNGVGIVRHDLHAETNDNGKPGIVDLAIMTVWTKEGKKWKLLARQAVKKPH